VGRGGNGYYRNAQSDGEWRDLQDHHGLHLVSLFLGWICTVVLDDEGRM
jgi:hypothetical protein